jgi:PPOX class probable F420-dependent enzyme
VSSKDLKNMMAAMSMSKEEIETFLSVPRMARMATTSSNGKPHLVPVWYYYDGTNILVTATKGTKRTKNVKNNPNVSIVIDIVEGKAEDISYLNAKAVVIEGEAEIRDDTDGSFAKKMYERYAGKNALDNPMVQASVIMPRYILTIRPVKVMSWDLSKIPKMSN